MTENDFCDCGETITGNRTMCERCTEDRLRDIERRERAATPGRWTFEHGTGDHHHIHAGDLCVASTQDRMREAVAAAQSYAEDRANAEFIAHSREDIPFLLAEIKRLTTPDSEANHE